MRNRRWMPFAGVLLAVLACSPIAFAQTYGTTGYAPGTWKKDELPKELANPKPFNPHDLSAVWSMPTARLFREAFAERQGAGYKG